MNRRTFVAGLAAAAFAPGIRIDTHTHFYDPTRPQGVPWPNPKESFLYRPVLPKHFRQTTRECGDVRTVVVEASPWVEDNQWLLDLAKDEPVIAGIVGNLRPAAPDYRQNLERFARNPLFRGIRVYPQNALKEISFERMVEQFRVLQDLDLQVDLNGGAAMFADVLRIAEKLPKLRIAINHLPYAWPAAPDERRVAEQAFRALSGFPLVYAKVSQFLDSAAAFRQAAVDEVWSVFGPDRVVYGSNWPLSDRVTGYATLMGRISAYVSARNAEAANRFFYRNAVAAYKLQIRT